MKRQRMKFAIETSFGLKTTWAVSERQAVSNVRHRLRLLGVSEYSLHVEMWRVVRVGDKEACRV